MGAKIVRKVKAGKGSKGNGITRVENTTGAGGEVMRHKVHCTGVTEPIAVTAFLRLLGYHGFRAAVADAVLEDSGFTPMERIRANVLAVHVGAGRMAGRGQEAPHGGVKESTLETYGAIARKLKAAYAAKFPDGFDTFAPVAKGKKGKKAAAK